MNCQIVYIWDMITKNEILLRLKELKPTLYKDFAVIEIGLFGSFADGNYTDESDIDLLVEFEKPIGWRFFTLELHLESIFKRKIDLVTRNSIKDQIKENILKQVNYA